MRRLGRTGHKDRNQDDVVSTLRRNGWFVLVTSGQGFGCPDAFAVRGGRLVAIEIKDGEAIPSRRKLTPDEQAVHREFAARGCPVVILESVQDAINL